MTLYIKTLLPPNKNKFFLMIKSSSKPFQAQYKKKKKTQVNIYMPITSKRLYIKHNKPENTFIK